ncbi:MAG: nucleotidyltransferase family protein [Pseudomonadota bacterium]|nr:nucleotidyltransferase family protein [Pseudomonadota bacterium]
MAKIKRAMVLAAGKGTRLGELTKVTPKPLIDLGGTTPLFRILKGLENAGMEEVVINCHWLAEKVIDSVEAWRSQDVFKFKMILSYEEELLETAGGINKAVHHFKGEPFVIANGDIVWGEGFAQFVAQLDDQYNAEKMDFLLALTPSSYSQKKEGDFHFCEDGRIDFLGESEISEISYCGLSVVHPRVLEGVEQGFLPLKALWLKASAEKTMYGYKADFPWVDMGTPEGLQKARDVIKYENGLPAKVLKFESHG